MRRVSARYVKTGMVMGRDLYDKNGNIILESGSVVSDDGLERLHANGGGEVLIVDDRLSDVLVSPVFSPELEGQATNALIQLIDGCRNASQIPLELLQPAQQAIRGMIRELFPEALGEINPGGCFSLDEFPSVQPVKVAGLCLLLGKRLGYEVSELIDLGMAALLKDIGYVLLPPGLAELENPTEEQQRDITRHPTLGAELIDANVALGAEAVDAVLQHHEQWDGTGYPRGLKRDEIAPFAAIVSMANAYYELVSVRPDQPAMMPHEAMEYVMAFSGELFRPDLVQMVTRQIPLYPTGLMVKLNTGETGIVSDANIGHIGRPMVRVCYDRQNDEEPEPYDVDLSDPTHQYQLVVQVLEY